MRPKLLLFALAIVFAGGCENKTTEPQAGTSQKSEAASSTSKTDNTSNLPLVSDTPPAWASKTPTETGAYLVTLRPKEDRFVIGKSQPWVASVTDSFGKVFTPTALYFDGGMPGHGHGLPSAPRFTRHLGGANYLLEGMTLNMPGDWRFVVTVGGEAGTDSAVFNMNIQPGPLPSSKSFQYSAQIASRPTNQNIQENRWSPDQRGLIESLRLDTLPPVADASNRLIGNPEAIELGRLLFNEKGLSAAGNISCASCHQESRGFADNKRFSFGSKNTARHTPALLGIGHANWFYWDGRRDSLWAQALTPIETQGEMDNNRTDAVRFVANNADYAAAFTDLAPEDAAVLAQLNDTARFPYGASPFGDGKRAWYRMSQNDRDDLNGAYATLGKIIASYEATLAHEPSRFDAFAATLADQNSLEQELAREATENRSHPTLTSDEMAGLELFLDLPKSQCLRCHNGPLFTNQGFHNVASAGLDSQSAGSAAPGQRHDFGRMLGLQAVIVDPFNCTGEFSDAPKNGCSHLTFARRQNLSDAIDGAFKVPGLRNLKNTAPYFHDGRFSTLTEVIDHYRNQSRGAESKAPGTLPRVSEVPDIDITDTERDQLVAFLRSL